MSKNKRLAGNVLLGLGVLLLLNSFLILGGLITWDTEADGSRSSFLLQGVACWIATALVLWGAFRLRGDGGSKDFFR